MRKPVWLLRVIAVVAVGLALVVYAVICWSIPRGFDWTDESWAYSLTASNRITVGEVWGFHYLLHPFFGFLGRSIIAFRVIRILIYFLLSLYFVAILHALARAKGWHLGIAAWIVVLAVSQIGSFLAWSYPPRSIGYNETSSWLLQVGSGAIVLIVGGRLVNRSIVGPRAGLLLWVVLGSVTMFLLAAKVTSGGLFGCIVVVSVMLRDPGVRAPLRILCAVVGAFVAVGLMIATGFPVGSYAHDLLALAFDSKARAAGGHPLGALIKSYLGDFSNSLSVIAPVLLPFIILVAVLAIRARATHQRFAIVGLIATGILAEAGLIVSLALRMFPTADYYLLGYFATLLGVMSVILLVVGLVSDGRRRKIRGAPWPLRTWVVGAFGVSVVAITPFLSTFGTNNPLTGELMYSASIWASTLAFLLVAGGVRWMERGSVIGLLPTSLSLVLLATSGLAVQYETFVSPYHTAPLQHQTVTATSPALRGLLLTKPAASKAGWLSTESKILRAERTPTISLDSPGALYAFNNSAYADPWLLAQSPISFTSVTAACERHRPARLLVIVPHRNASNTIVFSQVKLAFAKCRIAFPEDFHAVAHYSPGDPSESLTILELGNAP